MAWWESGKETAEGAVAQRGMIYTSLPGALYHKRFPELATAACDGVQEADV